VPAVRLEDAGYIFSSRWTANDFLVGREIIARALDEGLSRNWVVQQFVNEGISYKRQDMYEDLSRVWATEFSRDQAGYEEANSFFDAAKAYKDRSGVAGWYEPIQFARDWANESLSTLDQIEAASALAKEGYDPSPDIGAEGEVEE